eukprot:TRINITY_DN587_c0_g1_i15.p1 TRINITY_DN587_c0_g1~~TRINITY_DN587_c0_g1_i15.p1  ORF type:complete len:164 (-),score=40.96 TRINITY_DN587_c0_g1_i15:58-486(-)
MVDGKSVMVDILDTTGGEEYSAMRDQYMRRGEGFLIVYSVTMPDSLSSVKTFYDQIRRVKDTDTIACVLAGNKVDLESDRKVTTDKGKETAAATGGCPFFECSAKTRIAIDDVFMELSRRVLAARAAHVARPPASGGGCFIQ